MVRYHEKAISINFELTTTDIQPFLADRAQIAQVFVNLLRNSVDAINELDVNSTEPKSISITTSHEDNTAKVEILDTGSGVSQDISPFKPFDTSKKDGLAVGLSICCSIVESHCGKLWHDKNTKAGCKMSFTPAQDYADNQ